MNSSLPLFPCLWFYKHQEMAQDTLHVESQINSCFSSKVATKLTSSNPTKMSLADIKRKTKNNRQIRWGITMILKQCRNSLLHWTYIAYFLIGLLSCNAWHVSSPDCTNYGTTFQADLDYLVVGFADKSVTYTDLQAWKPARMLVWLKLRLFVVLSRSGRPGISVTCPLTQLGHNQKQEK